MHIRYSKGYHTCTNGTIYSQYTYKYVSKLPVYYNCIIVTPPLQFAPVFNQHDSMEQILKGERFPYVSDLLDLVLMPKVSSKFKV